MDIEERLSALRSGVETAKQFKLRAEMEAESALKDREEALRILQEEFGVDTLEQAKELLEKMRTEFSADISKAEEILRNIA